MAYLTFNRISTTKTFSKAQPLNESIKTRSYKEVKVFLSYRRKDKLLVEGVVRFLKNMEVDIYIDYLDETLEDINNESVATKLRNSIKDCSKFISLATPDSGNSKWMPWELGLGDRIVNYKNVVVLPLTNDPFIWNDQEYSKIYGRIESDYSFDLLGSDDWNIIYPNSAKIKLKQWLSN
jgi:hypothetical protein